MTDWYDCFVIAWVIAMLATAVVGYGGVLWADWYGGERVWWNWRGHS